MDIDKEFIDIDESLLDLLNQRIEKVEAARAKVEDGVFYSLVLIIREWSLDSYFELLEKVLRETDEGLLNAWYANYTKVLLFSGNPSSSYIDKHLGLFSQDKNIGAAIIKEADQLPTFLRLLKKLKTSRSLEPFYFQNDAFSAKNSIEKYTLKVSKSGMLLERFIVHVTHIFCEYFLRRMEKMPVALKIEVVDSLTLPEVNDYLDVRIVPNDTELVFVGGIVSAS
ncbi:MAG: DUF6182 family protein [Bacteroidota bacterium]